MTSACAFTNTSDNTLLSTTSMPATDSDLSVAFFCKVTTNPADTTALVNVVTAGGNILIGTAIDGLTVNVLSGGVIVTGGLMVLGQWEFVCYTTTPGRVGTLYTGRVGGPISSATGTGETPSAITNLQLAADGSGGATDSYLRGSMCGVRVWTRALTAAQVLAEAQQLSAANRSADLWAEWLLPNGANFADTSGHGRSLTPTTPANIAIDSAGPNVAAALRVIPRPFQWL